MKKSEIKFILICCCTYKRPMMLLKALNSLNEINFDETIKTEILIVDNDEKKSALEVVNEFNQKSKFKINYVVEQKRGIANARNKVLNEAIELKTTHILFFDDDEIADQNWLIEHIKAYKSNPDLLISSGPTYNKFEKCYPKFIKKNNIFKQSTTKKTGQKRSICASGNVFFPVDIAKNDKIYFNTDYIFMGGEDGDFFKRASKAGYTIFWTNEAVNYEIVDDERANLRWILNRHYYNGYSGSLLRFKDEKKCIKRMLFLIKIIAVFFIDIMLIIPSIFFGLTFFFNTLGMAYKTKGKIDGIIRNRVINYYENVCGK